MNTTTHSEHTLGADALPYLLGLPYTVRRAPICARNVRYTYYEHLFAQTYVRTHTHKRTNTYEHTFATLHNWGSAEAAGGRGGYVIVVRHFHSFGCRKKR